MKMKEAKILKGFLCSHTLTLELRRAKCSLLSKYAFNLKIMALKYMYEFDILLLINNYSFLTPF